MPHRARALKAPPRGVPPRRTNPIADDWLHRHVPFKYSYQEYDQPRDLSGIPRVHGKDARDARQWLNANVPFEFTYRESGSLRAGVAAPAYVLPRYAAAWSKLSPSVGAAQPPEGYDYGGGVRTAATPVPNPPGGGFSVQAPLPGEPTTGDIEMARAGCRLPLFPGQWNAIILAASLEKQPSVELIKKAISYQARELGMAWGLAGPAKVRLVKTSREPLEFKHPVIPDCGMDPTENALPPAPHLYLLMEIYVPADKGIATSEPWPPVHPKLGITIFQVRDPYATEKEKSKNKNAALVAVAALGVGAVLMMRSKPTVGSY